MQVRIRRPSSVWPFARLISVAAVGALLVTLVQRPETGLLVFWDFVVPLLPVVFLLAPGLWRNVCPMAAVNQVPRVLGITRGLPLPRFLERHGYAIGLVLFFGIASARNAGLEENAQTVALVLGGALLVPLLGGFAFRGKSGYCGSVCPLRGVQALYGQTPVAHVEPSHCRPCVACTANCPDVHPGSSLRGELEAEERGGSRYRRLLAGALPGFVVAFYLLPGAAEVGLAVMYAQFGMAMLSSLGLFFVLESVTRMGAERLAALYGAVSFALFYWFVVPRFANAIADLAGGAAPEWAIWEGRILMAGLATAWLARTMRKIRARSAGASARAAVAATARELPMAPVAEPARAGSPVAPAAEPAVAQVPARRRAAKSPARRTAEKSAADAAPEPSAAKAPDKRTAAKSRPKKAAAGARAKRPAARAPATGSTAKRAAKPPTAPAPVAGAVAKPRAKPAGAAPVPDESVRSKSVRRLEVRPASSASRASSAVAKAAPRPMAGTPAVPVPDRRSRKRPLRTPQVTILPEGRRMQTPLGSTLLDVADGNELGVESGCRMGICGCDPVYVCDGMENLSPAGDGERGTIERLGLPGNTRMACVARVEGDVVISLDPAAPVTGNGGAQKRVAPVQPKPPAPVEAAPPPPPKPRPRLSRQVAEDVKRVVVIGNGIAGVTAADHIRRHHGECSIDVVTEERHPFYNRTSVSRLIHARTGIHQMYLLPDAWYEERRINSWLNTTAARIDRRSRKVHLATGEKLPYDRLVLAMGASAHIPPVAGFGLEGSFSLRDADDAMRIRQYAQGPHCRRAAVVGGGVLGLEAAEALAALGIEVTVIERAYWLAPAQLDARAGRIVRDHVERLGIEVLLGAGVAALHGDGRLSTIVLDDGAVRDADLVLVAAGINPNVALARDAGLKVNRGVIVDDRMRTEDPAIFAAGDVAEHSGAVYGLWGAAVEQAEVAAMNALGAGASYAASIVPTHLKLSNIDVTSIGEPHGESGGAELVVDDLEDGSYRKLVLDGNRIIGAIMVGRPHEASTVLAAMRDGRDVGGDVEALQAGAWDVLNESAFEKAVSAAETRHQPAQQGLTASGRAAGMNGR